MSDMRTILNEVTISLERWHNWALNHHEGYRGSEGAAETEHDIAQARAALLAPAKIKPTKKRDLHDGRSSCEDV